MQTVSIRRMSSSRETMAAGTKPPRVMPTMAVNGPRSGKPPGKRPGVAMELVPRNREIASCSFTHAGGLLLARRQECGSIPSAGRRDNAGALPGLSKPRPAPGAPNRCSVRPPNRLDCRQPSQLAPSLLFVEARMKTIKGPAIFLAQFAGDARAVQFAGRDRRLGGRSRLSRACRSRPGTARLFDLEKAADSRRPIATRSRASAAAGVEITELSTHLQGQLVAVHPAYDAGLRRLRAAPRCTAIPKARQEWAVEQMLLGRQGVAAISG